MNINFEKTPNTIFDWAEKFSFAELNDSQKKEVLLYLSVEDYTGMHEASKSLKDIMITTKTTAESSKKQDLLDYFDIKRADKKQFKFESVLAWQAAALVLMVLSGWLFYKVFDLQKADTLLQVASKDTVYVTKEISAQPEHIHDTVYFYKESKSSNKKSETLEERESKKSENINPSEALPAKEQEYSGSAKGSSMKDDSLLKKFGFVAM